MTGIKNSNINSESLPNGKDTKAVESHRGTIKIILTCLVVMALWGSLFPIVQLGYVKFNIDTSGTGGLILFAGIRFLISGAIISVFCAAKRRDTFKANKRSIGGIFLVGLFAVVIHYACTYISLAKIDGSKTALLKQSGVLIFVCFSFLFFKDDKFSIKKLIGAVFGVLSILVVNMDALKFNFNIGTLLVIIASVCTVISNIIYKKWLFDVPSLMSTGVSQLFGGIVLTAVGIAFGGRINTISIEAVLIFSYIIAATVVSYSLWYNVVKKYQLSQLFIIKMSEPLFAALVSFVLPLNAKLTYNHLLAFLLVVVAVLISNMKMKSKVRSNTL